VLEKNSGDGGVVVLMDGPTKLKGCRLYPGRVLSLGFLFAGFTADGVRKTPVESRERLTPCAGAHTVPSEDFGFGRRSDILLGRGSDDGAKRCFAGAVFHPRSVVGAVAGRETLVSLTDCRRDGVFDTGKVVLNGNEEGDVSVGDFWTCHIHVRWHAKESSRIGYIRLGLFL